MTHDWTGTHTLALTLTSSGGICFKSKKIQKINKKQTVPKTQVALATCAHFNESNFISISW